MGRNEEAVDGSSLFYALNKAKERGSSTTLGNQHCMFEQAYGNGHKVLRIGGSERFLQELPALQVEKCYMHPVRSSNRN